MVVFMIIGSNNEPIYEIDVDNKSSSDIINQDDIQYLHQFILFSSLDMINSTMWTNNATYLRVVDKFNYLLVSAYVTLGGKYFILLHNGKSEDALRVFFSEAHELYVKYLINPFAIVDGPIKSPQFHTHIKTLIKRLIA